MQPVESFAGERRWGLARCITKMTIRGDLHVNEVKSDKAPPAVISAPPERDLELELKRNPHDENAKADVGSDESMDASDPPSSSQPGCSDEPAPSSTFPE